MAQQIGVKIVADSLSSKGHRITSMELVYPRIIHSELMTHRMFARNSASSRAIPFKRMLKMVLEEPFIPIAFQKDHSGMQGSQYIDPDKRIGVAKALEYVYKNIIVADPREEDDMIYNSKIMSLIYQATKDDISEEKTIVEWWLKFRDMAAMCAMMLNAFGVSKQLANRLLEPFMLHKVLITSTEWENFFHLRCPKYTYVGEGDNVTFRSRKDFEAHEKVVDPASAEALKDWTNLDWLKVNSGQAEIHMMDLAEKIWDAMNESTPKELQAGEWHIPYADKIDGNSLIAAHYKLIGENKRTAAEINLVDIAVKISTVMCARVSYTTIDHDLSEWTIDKYLQKYEDLVKADPLHASPLEHCAKCMDPLQEYYNFIKGEGNPENEDYDGWGWCRNYRGWIQLRHLVEAGKDI